MNHHKTPHPTTHLILLSSHQISRTPPARSSHLLAGW